MGILTLVLAAAAWFSSMRPACAQLVLGDPRSLFLSGAYPENTVDPMKFVNDEVGASIFYNSGYFGERAVIANVEGGYIWGGHEVFDRSAIPAGSPGAGTAVTEYVSAPEVTGEFDFHATMVGHILAGTGYVDNGAGGGSLTYVGMGMAPFAKLWSGAIATSYSSTDFGSFETTTTSTLVPYKAFFRGIDGRKADVINSSWGGSGDAAAVSDEVATIDALARENPTVAFVVAAGNGGTEAVSAPGSGYNNITVGSVGRPSFTTPSTFSSRGAVDFFNPDENGGLGVLHTGVRAAVDIAAPGEMMFLAAYLGPTGTLQYEPGTQNPSPTNRYFPNMDGTSFATPTVAGGIALLKDVAMSPWFAMGDEAFDTRVIKSVLMASSTKTEGWDNGQATGPDGVVRTTQALDYATGAGALDLTNAAVVYLLSGTRDVPGAGGGTISSSGWDFGTVTPGHSNDYTFDTTFSQGIVLTISLNWFAGTAIDAATDLGHGLSFADLNLELSLVTNGVFVTIVAESATVYNNTEFLRVDVPADGQYELRVTFLGLVYGPSPAAPESYGLAWSSAQPVPETSSVFLIVLGAGALVFAALRRRRS